MIKVAVGGANGRVGQLIVQAVERDPETTLAAKVIKENNCSNLKNVKSPVDVFIDFSVPLALEEHIKICQDQKTPMVIGITGLSDPQMKLLKEASKVIPIVYATNMSIGVNLSYQLLELAAIALKDQKPDVAILDIHHRHKKDAPSGTALQMASVINKAMEKSAGDSNITFSSLRLGDTVADSSVIFAMDGEHLEITHRATNRSVFAKGALQAAKWLMKKGPGLYNMQDVLE